MKRIISFLIALTLMLSVVSFTPVFADSDEEAFNEYIYHLRNLGILEGDENGEIQQDAIMTRAQFCALITKLVGAYKSVSGLPNNLFTDVPNNYWGKDYIVYCADLGLISGVGGNKFEPEAPVQTVQAIKILVELLGYGYKAKVNGGYPTGYLFEAKNLGLTTGVDLSEEEISMKNIARLVFNALDVDIAKQTGIEGNQVNIEVVEGANILTEYLSMNVTKGILDGCFSYVLAGAGNLEKDEVTIDRITYKYDGNSLDFMGQKVIAFYYYDEETSSCPELKSILPTTKDNKVITVDTSDIISAANNVITYEISETQEKDIKLNTSIKYVYNYELLLSYDIKKLPEIKSGKVEIIDNNNDNSYDVIKIFDYETFVIENASENYISGKLNGHSVDLTDTDKLIMISSVDGTDILPSKIKENNVAFVIETANTIDITVSTDVVSGIIAAIDGETVDIAGKTYDISKEYAINSNYIGSMVDLHLDPSGKVAFVIESISSDMIVGYFISLKEPPTEYMDGYIKILDVNGTVNSYKFNEKVKVGEVTSNIHGKFDNILDYLSDSEGVLMPQVIRYKLNEENLVTEIETSVKAIGNDKDGFVMPFGDYGVGKELEYYQGTFSGVVFPSTQTVIFLVPSKSTIENSGADDDDYGVLASEKIPNDRKLRLDAYYFSKDHQNADVVVLYDAEAVMSNIDSSFDNTMNIYLAKTDSINSDGDVVPVIRYFDGKEIKKLPVANGFTVFNNLTKGDIIRFSLDTKGNISSGEVVYRISTGTLTSKGSNYTASIRISGGYVASMRNNMMRVEEEKGASEGSEILGLTGYSTTSGTVMVVETANGIAHVRSGSSKDISVGDYVIVQQRSGNVKTIIIFK